MINYFQCVKRISVSVLGLPNLYLDPPPTEDNKVEVGHTLEVTCVTNNTFPSSDIFSYRVGSGNLYTVLCVLTVHV